MLLYIWSLLAPVLMPDRYVNLSSRLKKITITNYFFKDSATTK